MQPKKHAALSKKRRLGGIQIFRRALFVLQKTSAESDDFPNIIADREHDSSAKAIVRGCRVRRPRIRRITLGFCFDQSACDQIAHLIAPLARPTSECVPLVRRITQLPAFRDFPRDATGREIFSRRFAQFSLDEVFVEPLRSLSMQLEQTPTQFTLSLFIVSPTCARFLDDRDSSAGAEFVHG